MSTSIVSLILLLSSSAPAAPCSLDAIRRITGATLLTASGARYDILGQDFIDPKTWKRGERLKVCARPDNRAGERPVFDALDLKRNETLAVMPSRP